MKETMKTKTKLMYQINPTSELITLYFAGEIMPSTVTKAHPYYSEIYAALIDGDFDKVTTLFAKTKRDDVSAKKVNKIDWTKMKKQGAEMVDGQLYLNGKLQTGRLANIIIELASKRGDITPMLKFYERMDANPSSQSREEAFDFLQHRGLPITDEGMVRGYKGVGADGWSVSGNTNTVVLQGKVDEQGRILNVVGGTIEVKRNSVDDDRNRGCSHGLHVGTYEYASTFAPKLLLVEFDPADIVSVPTDCNCQKLRCSKYTVISEYLNDAPISDSIKEYDQDDIEYAIEVALSDLPAKAKTSVESIRQYVKAECLNQFDELSEQEFNDALNVVIEVGGDLENYVDFEEEKVNDIADRVEAYINKKGNPTLGEIQKSLNPTKVGCAELNGLVQELGFKVQTNKRGISFWTVR